MVWISDLQIPTITLPLENYIDGLPSELRDFKLPGEFEIGPLSITVEPEISFRSLAKSITMRLTPKIQGSIRAMPKDDMLVTDKFSIDIRADVYSPIGTIPIDTIFVGSVIVDPETLSPIQLQGILSIPLEPFLKQVVKPMILNALKEVAQ